MKRKKYVFISGPLFSSGLVTDNIRAAMEAADGVMRLGAVPFLPHQNIWWEVVHSRGEEAWMQYDLDWLRRCDAVLRLPGYSAGADREVALALEIGLPVFFAVTTLREWIDE